MTDPTYSASKSRSNRPGWSVTFRHPLRKDARGKLGRRVRRGLGTTDDAEAERLVAQMNVLLKDETWWHASKRIEATLKFSAPIVAAFYDEIQAGRQDPESLREEIIPLPTVEDGYSRVYFVGTTGAGKTSLLRQMIGSDPDKDRFPSTAPAKTTIADIEVTQSDGPYKAAVTFFTEFQTQANVEECIVDACVASREKASTNDVADRLLNHRLQRFRLSYILGGWREANDQEEDDDDFSFDAEPESISDQLVDGLTVSEREEGRTALRDVLERIGGLSVKIVNRVSDEVGVEPGETKSADLAALEELIEECFEEYLLEDESFHELVHDILDQIRERFDLIKEGILEHYSSGWPKRWQFETDDRERFVGQMRWFSSNDWRQFGRLLTPLVCGIRVKGPLFPAFTRTAPRLTLIDGQGLGHTPDPTSSLTTHITRRFNSVDVILLVDNAKQPMLDAPLSVIRSVATSGHSGKLAVAFTHFDQIKGPSLRTSADKRDHVVLSMKNALTSLRDVVGSREVRHIERGIDSRCFMLGGVDQSLTQLRERASNYMRSELTKLVELCENAVLSPPSPEARPIYDPTGVFFAAQEAVSKFQGPWRARLGLDRYSGVEREHWTRVKALNRRIAGELDDEYDTLRPVADLVARMTEAVSRFLDEPIGWTRETEDDQERQVAISQIRRTVATKFGELARQRLLEQHPTEWREAYHLRGEGSTVQRAQIIRGIYDDAAPAPDAVMRSTTNRFLAEVRHIVITAVEENDGKVELAKDG